MKSKFDKLRQARLHKASGSRMEESGSEEEEEVYEEIEEDTYREILAKDNFVVDDKGLGYVDYGQKEKYSSDSSDGDESNRINNIII